MLANLLRPFDGQDKMVITKTVQGLDSSLGVFSAFVADECKSSGLAGVFVLKFISRCHNFYKIIISN